MVFWQEDPKRDQKSEIHTPKRDDKHPHPFHMRSTPPSGVVVHTTMAVHSKIHTQLDIGILADVSIFETGFGRFDFNNI